MINHNDYLEDLIDEIWIRCNLDPWRGDIVKRLLESIIYPERVLDLNRLSNKLKKLCEIIDDESIPFSVERDYNTYDLFLKTVSLYKLSGLQTMLLELMMQENKYDKAPIEKAIMVVDAMKVQ